MDWQPISTALDDPEVRKMEKPILLWSSVHGPIRGWYGAGEWSVETPDHPREYSGAVWVLGDDICQVEIEEISSDWHEWHYGEITHWTPMLPEPNASSQSEQTALKFARKLRGTMKPLFIPLKTEYFRAFEDGSKSTEYRAYGPRWNERTCIIGRRATVSHGYSGARLSRIVRGFKILSRSEAPESARSIYPNAEKIAAIKLG